MQSKSNSTPSSGTDRPLRMPRTLDEATTVNAYVLASRWGDRSSWSALSARHAERLPVDERVRVWVRTVEDEVCELATMAALAGWLTRWQPAHLHDALYAGASLDQVCAATGLEPAEVAHRWSAWVAGQRHLTALATDPARVGAEVEYERVGQLLVGYLCADTGDRLDASR